MVAFEPPLLRCSAHAPPSLLEFSSTPPAFSVTHGHREIHKRDSEGQEDRTFLRGEQGSGEERRSYDCANHNDARPRKFAASTRASAAMRGTEVQTISAGSRCQSRGGREQALLLPRLHTHDNDEHQANGYAHPDAPFEDLTAAFGVGQPFSFASPHPPDSTRLQPISCGLVAPSDWVR
jgi:hypothetical protein